MATTKDKCLHINDIEQMVDKDIESVSIDDWMYVMKQAIRNEVQGYWYENMKKSRHRNEGRGVVYQGDAHGITRNPDTKAVDRQVQQVLNKLLEQKGVKL